MSGFGDAVVGSTFKKANIVFMVLDVQPYPSDRVSTAYRRVLGAPLGTLMAISYRGTLIPNIAVRGGVVRLTKIAVRGMIISTPKAISEALGVNSAYHPYAIHRLE